MECFGGDESSGTSSVRVARHGGDATIWLLVAFPGNPGRTRGGASGGGIHGRDREPMNIIQSLGGLETPGPDWSEREVRRTSKSKRGGPCGTSRGWCAHKGVSGRDESRGPRSRHERLTADGAARFPSLLVDQPQSIIIIYSLHSFSPARSARPWGPIDRSAQVLHPKGSTCLCPA